LVVDSCRGHNRTWHEHDLFLETSEIKRELVDKRPAILTLTVADPIFTSGPRFHRDDSGCRFRDHLGFDFQRVLDVKITSDLINFLRPLLSISIPWLCEQAH
jgi:hypothetical protein